MKTLRNGQPSAAVPRQEPPGLQVDPGVHLRQVQAGIDKTRRVTILVIVFLEPEGIPRIPFSDRAPARPDEQPSPEEGPGDLRIDSSILDLQETGGKPAVVLLPALPDLIDQQAADAGFFSNIINQVRPDGIGRRRDGRRDVVEGEGFRRDQHGAPRPKRQTGPPAQADAVLEEIRGIVQVGPEVWFQPVIEDFPVPRLHLQRFPHIRPQLGDLHELIKVQLMRKIQPDVLTGRREGCHRNALLCQKDVHTPYFRGDRSIHNPQSHSQGLHVMEVSSVGRLHPQIAPGHQDSDVAETGPGKGFRQPLHEWTRPHLHAFLQRGIGNGKQRTPEVKRNIQVHPDRVSPLVGHNGLQPVPGPNAQTMVEFRRHGLSEMDGIRRIAPVFVIGRRIVLNHARKPVNRGKLDTPEVVCIAPPPPWIGEKFRLEKIAGPDIGQLLSSIPPVGETEGEIERIDLLAGDDILGAVEPGPMWVHQTDGKSRKVFRFGQNQYLTSRALSL